MNARQNTNTHTHRHKNAQMNKQTNKHREEVTFSSRPRTIFPFSSSPRRRRKIPDPDNGLHRAISSDTLSVTTLKSFPAALPPTSSTESTMWEAARRCTWRGLTGRRRRLSQTGWISGSIRCQIILPLPLVNAPSNDYCTLFVESCATCCAEKPDRALSLVVFPTFSILCENWH
jgi:hypothetical protein